MNSYNVKTYVTTTQNSESNSIKTPEPLRLPSLTTTVCLLSREICHPNRCSVSLFFILIN